MLVFTSGAVFNAKAARLVVLGFASDSSPVFSGLGSRVKDSTKSLIAAIAPKRVSAKLSALAVSGPVLAYHQQVGNALPLWDQSCLL